MDLIDHQSGSNDLPDKFYQIAASFIKKSASVLNFGCGTKFNFERVVFESRDCLTTSVDIQIAHHVPNYVNFIQADVEKPISLELFDFVTFFELIEHIDKTDELLRNCSRNLKSDGKLIFSFPNLSSFYSRIELFLGYQPHILEVSNEIGYFGSGIFGKINSGGCSKSIHHIRGITQKAMIDLITYHGFNIEKIIGTSINHVKIFNWPSSIAPQNIFLCTKKPL